MLIDFQEYSREIGIWLIDAVSKLEVLNNSIDMINILQKATNTDLPGLHYQLQCKRAH